MHCLYICTMPAITVWLIWVCLDIEKFPPTSMFTRICKPHECGTPVLITHAKPTSGSSVPLFLANYLDAKWTNFVYCRLTIQMASELVLSIVGSLSGWWVDWFYPLPARHPDGERTGFIHCRLTIQMSSGLVSSIVGSLFGWPVGWLALLSANYPDG